MIVTFKDFCCSLALSVDEMNKSEQIHSHSQFTAKHLHVWMKCSPVDQPPVLQNICNLGMESKRMNQHLEAYSLYLTFHCLNEVCTDAECLA